MLPSSIKRSVSVPAVCSSRCSCWRLSTSFLARDTDGKFRVSNPPGSGLSAATIPCKVSSLRLPELPLTGTYRIRISHEGQAPQDRSDIQLGAGRTAAIDAVLSPAVAAEITVYGTAEGVQSDAPQLGTVLDNAKIQDLRFSHRARRIAARRPGTQGSGQKT